MGIIGKFDPVAYANYARSRQKLLLVRFAVAYLSVTTAAFLVLLYIIAFGFAHLPDALVKIIAGATVGQFAGVPLLLYRAYFRESNNKKRKS